MDDETFDRIARRFEGLTSRRGAFGALAGAGVLSTLGGLRLEVMAKGKKKKKKKCKPKSNGATCAGKCGSVKNNCKKTVECGLCPVCQRCSDNVCEPDPDQFNDGCGFAGQVCLANGACACDANSCGGSTVCIDGSCEFCGESGQPCCGNTCVGGTVCVDDFCEPCGFLDASCCSTRNCIPSPGLGCFGPGVGTCELCGDSAEQCCPNRICETGRVCLGEGNGTCLECGIAGQPCCANNTCSLGAICVSGNCED